MSETLSGAEFKKQLRAGQPKIGLFLNSHSPTVADQMAHSGYDWLLVDSQHGPLGFETLSAMLGAISNGGAKSLVRVAGYHDRGGIQQSLDLGADGVLVPYINTAEEARQAVSCCKYPTAGTRSVYFPQRSMNKAGLLGYAGASNENTIVALQVETADCIKNIDEIAAVPGVDLLFLGCALVGEVDEQPQRFALGIAVLTVGLAAAAVVQRGGGGRGGHDALLTFSPHLVQEIGGTVHGGGGVLGVELERFEHVHLERTRRGVVPVHLRFVPAQRQFLHRLAELTSGFVHTHDGSLVDFG